MKEILFFWHFPHYHGSMWKPGSALRNNDWKLVELHEENKIELYNLRDDLSETVDVSNKFPEITSRLVSKLNEIKIDLGANKATFNENYNN